MKTLLLCIIVVIVLTGAVAPTAVEAQATYHIAFSSTRSGNEEIWIATASGSNPTNVTHSDSRDWHPSWSPDGRRIAFVSDRTGDADIYLLDVISGDLFNLTTTPESNEYGPDWSPDGQSIVFTSDRDGGFDLYSINQATRAVERLTNDGLEKGTPAWYPDSRQVAYFADAGSGPQLFNVDISTGQRYVLTDAIGDSWPAFSPNGFLAFERQIGEVKAIGLRDLTLADHPLIEWTTGGIMAAQPAWSVDGQQLAFVANLDTTLQIFTASVDGTAIQQITGSEGNNFAPAWQPVPLSIPLTQGSVGIGLSMESVLGNVNPEDLVGLGVGQAGLIPPPEQVSSDDPIIVRAYVTVGDQALPSEVVPGDTLDLDVYNYMSAELVGANLARFDSYPANGEQITIRLDPDGENFWEWELSARPEAIGKTSRLRVRFYRPALPDEHGTLLIRRVTDELDFSVTVTAGASIEPTIEVLQPLGMRLYGGSLDSFTLEMLNDNLVTGLGVFTARGEGDFTSDFQMSGVSLGAGTCLQYVREGAQPVIPSSCRDTKQVILPYGEVFWFNPFTRLPAAPLLVYHGDLRLPCVFENDICSF